MGIKIQKFLVVAVGFLLTIIQSSAFASSYFDNLKLDQTVPVHCRKTVLSNFDVDNIEVFTMTLAGKRANNKFTFKYPLKRSHASYLWQVMKDLSRNGYVDDRDMKRINDNPELKDNFELMADNYKKRGFSFGSEGEVLELLAQVVLEEYFVSKGMNVFVTGSIQYRQYKSGISAMGELDVVIGDKETCKVYAYGEAKLGSHRASKAWSQVHRFLGFLNNKGIIPQYSIVQEKWMDLGLAL